jgi:hypothetical protein
MRSRWFGGRHLNNIKRAVDRAGLGRLNVPSVTCGVDGRKGDTAVLNFEVGLVLEHELSYNAGWNGLGEANDGIVVDDSTALEVDGRGEDDARGCEELDSDVEHLERLDVERM